MTTYTKEALAEVLEQHALWLAGNGGQRACLEDANLWGADLRDADLRGACLRGADLQGAGLVGAKLQCTNLWCANLLCADLEGANLEGACLEGACLEGADLRGADLRGADLRGAGLRGANLRGTCLDPVALIPEISDADITSAGLEIRDNHVYGFRTRKSRHVGQCEYVPGQTYTAPHFSVSNAACHPGLYLASQAWLDQNDYSQDRVPARCLREDLHRAGGKFRCRKLEVL